MLYVIVKSTRASLSSWEKQACWTKSCNGKKLLRCNINSNKNNFLLKINSFKTNPVKKLTLIQILKLFLCISSEHLLILCIYDHLLIFVVFTIILFLFFEFAL